MHALIPWSGDGIEYGDGGRDINSDDLVEADFRDQHACGDDNAVEVEGNDMCHNLPHKEESIYNMKLLPHRHPLYL